MPTTIKGRGPFNVEDVEVKIDTSPENNTPEKTQQRLRNLIEIATDIARRQALSSTFPGGHDHRPKSTNPRLRTEGSVVVRQASAFHSDFPCYPTFGHIVTA